MTKEPAWKRTAQPSGAGPGESTRPFIKESGKRGGSIFFFFLFGGRRGKSKGLERKGVKRYSDYTQREDHPFPAVCLTSPHAVEGMVKAGG